MLPFLGSSLLPFVILALYSWGYISGAPAGLSAISATLARRGSQADLAERFACGDITSDEFLERSSIPCRSLSRSRRTLSVTLPAEHSPPPNRCWCQHHLDGLVMRVGECPPWPTSGLISSAAMEPAERAWIR